MVAEDDLVRVVWTLHGTNSVPLGNGSESRGTRHHGVAHRQLRIARPIVSQLKWQLMGLPGAVVVLIWVAARLIAKLWHIDSPRAATATS